MEEILSSLHRILENAKKSVNRPYKKETILSKLDDIEFLKERFNLLIQKNQGKDLSNETTQFANEFTQIKEILNHMQEGNTPETPITNMASFNIETASKAIPTFTGNYKDLPGFLKVIELIHNTLSEDARKTLIEYVCFLKLNEKVRAAISSLSTISTLEALKQKLLERYKNPLSAPQIHTKLSQLKQNRLPILAYKDKLLDLIGELNSMQTLNLVQDQANAITTINNEYALTIFKNGLNEHYKSIIFAAQPKDLSTAINLCLEIEQSNRTTSTDQILNIRQRQQQINRNQRYQTNNNTNQRRPKYNNNNNRNYNNNYGNNNARNQTNNNNNYQNNNYNNNNTNNRNNNYNNNNRNQNYYNRNRNNNNNNNNYRNNNNNIYRRTNPGQQIHYVHQHNQGNDHGPETAGTSPGNE